MKNIFIKYEKETLKKRLKEIKETEISKQVNIARELTEELDKVTAGVPSGNNDRDWCPKVKVEPINTGELTEEELDEVKAGVPKINDERY